MYEINSLFFYRPLFVTELLLAETLFLFRIKPRGGLWWRIPLALAFTYGSAFLFPTSGIDGAWYSMVVFVAMFLFSIVGALLIFDADWRTLLFCSFAGFNLQHLCYESYHLIRNVSGLSAGGASFYDTEVVALFSGPLDVMAYILSYLTVFFVCYWVYARNIRKGERISLRSHLLFALSIITILSDVAINSLVVSYGENLSEQIVSCIDALSILLCILALSLQFEIAYRNKLSDDVAYLKIVRSKEREHYRLSRENAELIDIKVHDLKHQIHEIGESKSVSPEVLSEIDDVINVYDSFAHSGNPSLDLVLSEKALIAEKNKIRLSLIIDGNAVSFMKESDIFALFSNLLDNAIEATMNLDEEERSISLSVRTMKNFVSIVSSNRYFNPNMKFVNGLPVTIKKDKINHGYGLKSIRYMVNKFDGDLTIEAKDGIFTVTILLPVPAEKEGSPS